MNLMIQFAGKPVNWFGVFREGVIILRKIGGGMASSLSSVHTQKFGFGTQRLIVGTLF